MITKHIHLTFTSLINFSKTTKMCSSIHNCYLITHLSTCRTLYKGTDRLRNNAHSSNVFKNFVNVFLNNIFNKRTKSQMNDYDIFSCFLFKKPQIDNIIISILLMICCLRLSQKAFNFNTHSFKNKRSKYETENQF